MRSLPNAARYAVSPMRRGFRAGSVSPIQARRRTDPGQLRAPCRRVAIPHALCHLCARGTKRLSTRSTACRSSCAAHARGARLRADAMMTGWELIEGAQLEGAIEKLFADLRTAYLHAALRRARLLRRTHRAGVRKENHPPPRSGGGGTTRRVVEGASDSTLRCRRRMIVEARAPSTILLRRMVPLPRFRGAGWIFTSASTPVRSNPR